MKTPASGRDLSGILAVDKPQGPTSHDVVHRIRRASGIRRVGHAGTLDPMATGLLVVCLGRATGLVPFIQDGTKDYSGRLLLGMATETADVTGLVTAKSSVPDITREELENLAREFVGLQEQTPPAYSAVKILGRPAYALARQGRKVRTSARTIEVHYLTITAVDGPLVSFQTRVSKGTYIRSLVVDLGRRLGLPACLESLRRLACGPLTITQARPLEELENLGRNDEMERFFIPARTALDHMPLVRVSARLGSLVACGRPLEVASLDGFVPQVGPIGIEADDERLLAVYEYHPPTDPGSGLLTPIRVLCGQ